MVRAMESETEEVQRMYALRYLRRGALGESWIDLGLVMEGGQRRSQGREWLAESPSLFFCQNKSQRNGKKGDGDGRVLRSFFECRRLARLLCLVVTSSVQGHTGPKPPPSFVSASTDSRPFMENTPTVEEIRFAATQIKDYIHKTPVITSTTINGFASETLGLDTRLLFKCENFQKIGAFKIRGATYALKRLLETVRPDNLTVITHSSGNHAQALALASKLLGVQCQVVMPSNAPNVKKNAVKGYGAIVTECEPTLEAREATVETIIHRLEAEANRLGQERIVRLVPPYDHPDIIRGQGTIALELFEQAEELGLPLDVVIAPVGGGGMLSGVAVASKGLVSRTLVFGAEPSGASDAQKSFRDKTFHPSVNPTTIADGLLTSLGKFTFPLILENVDDIFTVTDTEIAMAMKLLWERAKIVVEPSSCVTLAVVLYSKEFKERMSAMQQHYGRQVNIGLVLSGGNVDLASCLEILSKV